jgi:hypothetical protein
VGQNKYGFLPFQTSYGQFAWRVSIFPYYTPPLTGVFAGLVFLVNFIQFRKNKIILLLYLFYLIFSGSRSVILGVGIALIPFFIKTKFQSSFWRTLLPYSLIILFIFIPTILPFIISKISNPFVQELLFRDFFVQRKDSISEVGRIMFINEYWKIFQDNFLFGQGSFSLSEITNIDERAGGGEVRLLNYLATFGISFIGFLYFMVKFHFSAEKRNDTTKSAILLFILAILLFYGTYMRGYHFINQLLFIYLFFTIKE